jgi:hypothetical protein
MSANRLSLFVALACLQGVAAPDTVHASPCSGMAWHMTEPEKARITPAVVSQLKTGLPDIKKATILDAYRYGSWKLIVVETDVSDDGYLFYNGDPSTSHYSAVWGGAAAYFEGDAIKDWAIKNVHGIPISFASCFAWSVTPRNGGRL